MEKRRFEAGEVIFAEGDPGDVAYMVETGRVEISRETERRRMVLGEVEAGGLFGEMALINDLPRMATATACEPTQCVLIPLSVFHRELERSSPLMRALVLTFIRHVRHLTGRVEELSDEAVQYYVPDPQGLYKRLTEGEPDA